MDKATVIADLAKVNFYSEITVMEIKKDPFDPIKIVNAIFDIQNALLRITTELLTDSVVRESSKSQNLQQLNVGIGRALSNIPE